MAQQPPTIHRAIQAAKVLRHKIHPKNDHIPTHLVHAMQQHDIYLTEQQNITNPYTAHHTIFVPHHINPQHLRYITAYGIGNILLHYPASTYTQPYYYPQQTNKPSPNNAFACALLIPPSIWSNIQPQDFTAPPINQIMQQYDVPAHVVHMINQYYNNAFQ